MVGEGGGGGGDLEKCLCDPRTKRVDGYLPEIDSMNNNRTR